MHKHKHNKDYIHVSFITMIVNKKMWHIDVCHTLNYNVKMWLKSKTVLKRIKVGKVNKVNKVETKIYYCNVIPNMHNFETCQPAYSYQWISYLCLHVKLNTYISMQKQTCGYKQEIMLVNKLMQTYIRYLQVWCAIIFSIVAISCIDTVFDDVVVVFFFLQQHRFVNNNNMLIYSYWQLYHITFVILPSSLIKMLLVIL